MSSTPDGARLTEAHRLAQARLGARTVQQMRVVWPLLDPAAVDQTFARWLSAAKVVVGANRNVSSQLAASYYMAFRQLELGIDAPPVTPVFAEAANAEQLATSLLVTGPVSLKNGMARGLPIAKAAQAAEVNSARASMRLSLDGGRETLTSTIGADPNATGWQRVTSGNACAFCEMLAGRGTVYKEDSADFASHDHCSCSAEPTFEGAGRSVRDFTPSSRNISDADRARVRDWIAANPHAG